MTGCLEKMQKRECIYNRARRKASRALRAVYFCLPKVTSEEAHAGGGNKKVRLQPLVPQKCRAKGFLLQSKKEDREFWLCTGKQRKLSARATKNRRAFSCVYGEENGKRRKFMVRTNHGHNKDLLDVSSAKK